MKLLPASLITFVAACGGGVAQDGQEVAGSLPTKTLAIVEDGESWYYEGLKKVVLAELKSLSVGQYELELQSSAGNYDGDAIEGRLQAALGDPAVDAVYAAGTIATMRAFSLAKEAAEPAGGKLAKPVMAGAVRFRKEVDLEDVEQEEVGSISSEMTSTIPNYTFVTSPRRVIADLTLLKELTGASRVPVLVDGLVLRELPEEVRDSFEFLKSGETVAETLRGIPADVKNLYVAIQPRLDDGERKALYGALKKRGVRTVSMHGGKDVELGAMAGLARDNGEVVARRMALNLHQMLQGVATDRLVVSLPVADRLVINMETGEAVGWAPSYDTVLEADILNEVRSRGGKELTLQAAMGNAANSNAEVLAERESVIIAKRDTDLLRAKLLPSAGLGVRHGGTRFSDRINPLSTPAKAHEGTYGLELRQVLFSDELWSNLRARRISEQAAELDLESRRLDATEAAAGAVFDYLTAKALYEIEKENVELTENNLEMARLRVEIGAAIPSEVYRWEQGRARSKAVVFQRDAARENARVELNRVMGAPREAVWSIADIEVGDDEFFFLGDDLKKLVRDAREFRVFGRFVQSAAVQRSPELASFEVALAAQGIVLQQLKRRYFLPEISGSASLDRVVSGSSVSRSDGQNEAAVGIVFSLPLFEGGGRRAEIRKQEALIRQIEAQRNGALQQIEQRVLVAFHGISSSHPTIRLSREGLRAAELNYESVNERYVRNAVTQLDILDAQSALLQQRQEEAAAVYDYLRDIYALQRALAWFEYDKPEEEKRAFVDWLERYLDGEVAGAQEASAGGEVRAVEDAGRGRFQRIRKNGKR